MSARTAPCSGIAGATIACVIALAAAGCGSTTTTAAQTPVAVTAAPGPPSGHGMPATVPPEGSSGEGPAGDAPTARTEAPQPQPAVLPGAADVEAAGDLGVLPDVESDTAPDLMYRTAGHARTMLPNTDLLFVNADGSLVQGRTEMDAIICGQDPAAGGALTGAAIKLVTVPTGRSC